MSGLAIRIDDVLREVRYANWAGWAWHYGTGRPAKAQNEGLRRGWLAPLPRDPRRLCPTAIGRAEIERRQEHPP